MHYLRKAHVISLLLNKEMPACKFVGSVKVTQPNVYCIRDKLQVDTDCHFNTVSAII